LHDSPVNIHLTVAVLALNTLRRKSHSDDPRGNIGKIKVKSVFLESFLVARNKVPGHARNPTKQFFALTL